MFYHAFSYIHLYLQNLFFFVDVRHCFGLQETQAASADARPNHHSKLGASQFLSPRITRSCVPLMPAPAAAAGAAPGAAGAAAPPSAAFAAAAEGGPGGA